MAVRTDDGLSVAFDLKDYNRIDHGYAATIHKAQGMTVDRTHVLTTPGLDAHGSYVALSRHRNGMDLHYGRDDFADHDRLTRTLSRDRAKNMATDYECADPAQDYAERRGITFRARVAQIMRKIVPEKVRDMLDGLRQPGDAAPGSEDIKQPVRERAGKRDAEPQAGEDSAAALRRARGRAFVRHASAVDAIFKAQEQGGKASPEQERELHNARAGFDDLRPHGARDAETVYKRNLSTWTVTDDWPDPVPVTEAEIEVFERWFGDLFDELLGSPDAWQIRQYAVYNRSKEIGHAQTS